MDRLKGASVVTLLTLMALGTSGSIDQLGTIEQVVAQEMQCGPIAQDNITGSGHPINYIFRDQVVRARFTRDYDTTAIITYDDQSCVFDLPAGETIEFTFDRRLVSDVSIEVDGEQYRLVKEEFLSTCNIHVSLFDSAVEISHAYIDELVCERHSGVEIVNIYGDRGDPNGEFSVVYRRIEAWGSAEQLDNYLGVIYFHESMHAVFADIFLQDNLLFREMRGIYNDLMSDGLVDIFREGNYFEGFNMGHPRESITEGFASTATTLYYFPDAFHQAYLLLNSDQQERARNAITYVFQHVPTDETTQRILETYR